MRRRISGITVGVAVLFLGGLEARADGRWPQANAAKALVEAGRFAEGEAMLNRVLPTIEREVGHENIEVGKLLYIRSIAIHEQGRYQEAEEICRESFRIARNILGADHPVALEMRNRLGSIFQDQGRNQEALVVYEELLAKQSQLSTPNPRVVSYLLNNLGSVYLQLGRVQEAQEKFEYVLALQEKTLAPDDPDLAISLNNLGALLSQKGDLETGERLLRRALAIREKRLGADHPDIAWSLSNLAELSKHLHRIDEAEALYTRAMSIFRKGAVNDVRVARTLTNLGFVYQMQRKYDQAEAAIQQGLTIREKCLGPDHPDVAESLIHLSGVMIAREELSMAALHCERALRIIRASSGEEDLPAAFALNNLGFVRRKQKRYTEAGAVLRQAIGIFEKETPYDWFLAGALWNMAGVQFAWRNYSDAEGLLRRAIEIWEKRGGGPEPGLLKALEDYAAVLRKLNRNAEAKEVDGRVKGLMPGKR